MTSDFGIYIHTPWCRTRCPYCAFNVFLDDSSDYLRWKNGIIDAWRAVAGRMEGAAHSLYFGGGTPSLAPPAIIGELIDALPIETDAEITLEVNPGTIDAVGLQAFREAGVNRVSLGIQTFHPDHAKKLGRGHTATQAIDLLHHVPTIGFNSWSMDLMFSLPDQSEDELSRDLDALLEIGPPHVSIYGLSIEPYTPFHKAFQAGKFDLPEPEAWRRMYDNIVDRLQSAGLHR